MEIQVDREPDVVAGDGRLIALLDLANDAEARVDLEPTRTRDTPELALENPLDASLPDLVVELVGLGVLRFGGNLSPFLLPFGAVYRADVAQEVGGQRTVRIRPDRAFDNLDPRKLVRPFADEDEQFRVHVNRYGNAFVGTVGLVIKFVRDRFDLD